jgi:hypothetical protein
MHPSEIICVLAVVIILLNLNINRRLPPSLYLIFRNLWFKFVVNSSGHNRQGLRDELPAVYPEFGGGFWGHGFFCAPWCFAMLFVWGGGLRLLAITISPEFK